MAKRFHQQPGIDYDETFSPVVKPTTVRTVLSLDVSNGWSVRQLVVKNTFLHSHLKEEVCICLSPLVSLIHNGAIMFVCHLIKALYGLKQTPQVWFHRFSSYLIHYGFLQSKVDSSLFIFHQGPYRIWLLLYVNDIVLTNSNPSILLHFITALSKKFDLNDLITFWGFRYKLML